MLSLAITFFTIPAGIGRANENEFVPCIDGEASGYPCRNVRLFSNVTLDEMDGIEGNDLWGWTDAQTGREYALMGVFNGVAFVDVTNPNKPRYLGKLATQTQNSIWRDIKTYGDFAFVVSEADNHGLQIFDLTQLRDVSEPPESFQATQHYDQFGSAHNLAINEDSGYAYVLGSTTCSGGLHMIDISNALQPNFAGCFSADGYTHDAQCVIYHGPDVDYQGHEICFNANVNTLTIVDVSDKANPDQISRKTYSGFGYTHQGWLTEDHATFLLGDESDELYHGHNSRTYIWNVSDLDEPDMFSVYSSSSSAIDHNIYIKENIVYEANYRSGIRILDGTNVASGQLTEIAFLDTFPANDYANFNGAWSVYPFFDSGHLIVSDIDSGLFVLELYQEQPPPPKHRVYLPSFLLND